MCGNCGFSGCGDCTGIPTTRGVRGYIGPPGATPTFTTTTTTLAPGEDATSTVTGTALNPVLNLGIPAGEQGDQGIQGDDGTDGTDGKDSYTVTTADFVQPVADTTLPLSGVTISVAEGDWPAVGQKIVVATGGTYILLSKTSTTLELNNPGYPDNATAGATITSGSRVGPGGDRGATGATGATGSGTNGTTPTLRSGSGVPSNGLGVDGDWYAQQVNSGKVTFYGKGAGAYTTQGYVQSNRLFVFTGDPNTYSIDANDQDQGTWIDGSTVNQYYYNAGTTTWVLFNTFTNGGTIGPSWAFYANKALSQAVLTTSSDFTKINFEVTTPPYFNNSGSWSLNTNTLSSGMSQTYTIDNLVASRSGTSGTVLVNILICKNGNTGAPLATGVLTITNTFGSGTLGTLQLASTAFSAADTVSVYANPQSTIAGLTFTAGQLYNGV